MSPGANESSFEEESSKKIIKPLKSDYDVNVVLYFLSRKLFFVKKNYRICYHKYFELFHFLFINGWPAQLESYTCVHHQHKKKSTHTTNFNLYFSILGVYLKYKVACVRCNSLLVKALLIDLIFIFRFIVWVWTRVNFLL